MNILGESRDLLTRPLSRAMRDESRREHREAEDSRFVTALLEGRVDESGYTGYLQRLRAVYASIELVGRALGADPCARAVLDPALERLDAIDADLAFWSQGRATPVHSPAAEAYASRVQESASWGGLFVAHHYTRYLGDLSGGQAIGRILTREFGLADSGEGAAFYTFAEVHRPKPYKDAYRARLDALELRTEDKARIVTEVKAAFRLNKAIFAELDVTLTAHARPPRSR